MRIFDLIKLSLRMFKARAMRTFLTVLGMSVGIAAIIFLVSFGYGLQRTLLQKITTSDALVSLDVTQTSDENTIPLNDETLKTLQSLPNVTDTIPVLELAGQGKFDTVTLDINTVSAPASFLKSEGLKISTGRFFTKEETTNIVITQAVAKVFNLTPEEMIGKPVAITLFQTDTSGRSQKRSAFALKESYTIVGVVQGEENIVYLSLDSLDGFPLTSYTKLKVKCSSTSTLDSVRTQIEELGLAASSISETVDQANKVFGAVQVVLMIFGLIALIVSAIGMFNTMTIALLERTEEIGIMKAIGAAKRSIALMFLTESTIMGLLGALGGVILGFLEGEVLNILINMIATRFGGESVDLFFSPFWFVSTVILFGAGVGFATGIFPARKASRIDTLEALRYK
ncbi:MAG: ABC transporter permease [Candidatus Moranbacteria bacterium]|nr:ABC transporter permease [Candidatus Moranbacteria bacterium]MBP9801086.1 ABC transporter permease [Candidatus Moranbacteria bacterium]